MIQLQGYSAPTQLVDTGAMVHLALWSPLLRRTRCGVVFDDNWTAERVDAPVSCMTCLTRADTFEVPLKADRPHLNYLDETCWMKQVFGLHGGHVIECCHVEDPCDWHKPKEPP